MVYKPSPKVNKTCPICLGDFLGNNKDFVRKINECNHLLHEVCLMRHLNIGKFTCPICNSKIDFSNSMQKSENDTDNLDTEIGDLCPDPRDFIDKRNTFTNCTINTSIMYLHISKLSD